SLAHQRQGSPHVISVGALHPLHAHTLDRIDDRVISLTMVIWGTGRWNVLTARRSRIAVVDDDRDVIMLVEDGIADAAGEAVMPETAVTHDGYSPLASIRAERGCGGSTQAVAHDAVSHVEWRQGRERMAADVGADVQRPRFLLQNLHRREKRPLRTSGTQPRG